MTIKGSKIGAGVASGMDKAAATSDEPRTVFPLPTSSPRLPAIHQGLLQTVPLTPQTASSTVDLPKIVSPEKQATSRSEKKVRHIPRLARSVPRYCSPDIASPVSFTAEGSRLQEFNPEPMPYQSPTFKLSQRYQLHSDYAMLEKMRRKRSSRNIVPHRVAYDLHMGGKRCLFSEREDITSQIMRLKQIVLPTKARDLYVGRGFKLPSTHAINKPRKLYSRMSRAPPASPLKNDPNRDSELKPVA